MASANVEQENVVLPLERVAEDIDGKQEPLTVSLLKDEVLVLHDYISTHQKQVDEYPSILPVDLQQADGEKLAYWYSSQFGWRNHPLTKQREFHQGLDIKTPSGIPVIAAAAGKVAAVKTNGNLGKTIEIEHEAILLKTLYAHLQDYADGLKVGDPVTRGQLIGYVGNTGRSTGSHLHYGIYDISRENWINPVKYILDQQPTVSP
ncbi:MAG: M23 family metallopeptidase [Candidatus Poribacteria bacterium]|nr:M23 family metallopeptidase [Candidatus Poribacteria bacterium]